MQGNETNSKLSHIKKGSVNLVDVSGQFRSGKMNNEQISNKSMECTADTSRRGSFTIICLG